MNIKKISSFIVLAIFSITGFNAFAKDVHGVFCGSELRPNYVEIADEYMKNNPGVNVTRRFLGELVRIKLSILQLQEIQLLFHMLVQEL